MELLFTKVMFLPPETSFLNGYTLVMDAREDS